MTASSTEFAQVIWRAIQERRVTIAFHGPNGLAEEGIGSFSLNKHGLRFETASVKTELDKMDELARSAKVAYHNGTLSPEKIQSLEAISGWSWDRDDGIR